MELSEPIVSGGETPDSVVDPAPLWQRTETKYIKYIFSGMVIQAIGSGLAISGISPKLAILLIALPMYVFPILIFLDIKAIRARKFDVNPSGFWWPFLAIVSLSLTAWYYAWKRADGVFGPSFSPAD